MKKHRFELIFVIILFLNIPIAVYRLIPWYRANYDDYDKWLSIATWLYTKMFNPAYPTPSYVFQIRTSPYFNTSLLPMPYSFYYHDFSPIYPLLIAISTIFFKDIYVSGAYIEILANILLLAVVWKIATEFLHLSKDKVFMILALFASSYMVAEYFVVPFVFPLYGLLGTLDIYLNLLYFRKPSLKIMVCLCISNTLTLYCEPLIWPLIFLPELFLILLFVMKGKVEYLKKYRFMSNFIMLSIFTTILPVLFYGAFFFGFDGWASINATFWSGLTFYNANYFPYEFPLKFLVSFFYTITFAWVFVFAAMRRDFRMARQQLKTNFIMVQEGLSSRPDEIAEPRIKKGHASFAEQLSSITHDQTTSQAIFYDKFLMKMMLYFWLAFFFIFKVALYPFYPHYYYPIMFALIFLTFQGLSTRKSYEKWFWVMIVVNSVLNVTQIILMAPWQS